MSTTMTIRLDDDLKDQLDQLATATQRSKSFLAAEAIREFIELNEWQVREIQQAIKEADAGEFATDSEVVKTFETLIKRPVTSPKMIPRRRTL
jgi:predicted transcriptional regulator